MLGNFIDSKVELCTNQLDLVLRYNADGNIKDILKNCPEVPKPQKLLSKTFPHIPQDHFFWQIKFARSEDETKQIALTIYQAAQELSLYTLLPSIIYNPRVRSSAACFPILVDSSSNIDEMLRVNYNHKLEWCEVDKIQQDHLKRIHADQYNIFDLRACR